MDISKLKFKEINSLDILIKYEDKWSHLFLKLEDATPFQSWEWNWCLAKEGYKDNNLRVLVLEYKEELVGVAPFILKKHFLGLKILEFIGSKESDYLNILCVEKYRESFIRNVMEWLSYNNKWHEISLSGLSFDTAKYLKSFHNSMQIEECELCPYLVTEGSFSDYVKSLPAGLRKKTKRIINKLNRENRIAVEFCTDKAEIMNNIDIFFELHQKRFISKGQTGKFYNENLKEQFRSITEQLSSNNLTLLVVIYVDGVPVCIDYLLSHQKILYGYLRGMHPDYLKYSLGNISTFYIIERAYKNDIKMLDFMRGNEAYKSQWTNSNKNTYRLTLSRNKIISLILKMIKFLVNRLSDNELVMKVYTWLALKTS